MDPQPPSTVRDTELHDLLARVHSGAGGSIVVRAPAGMGKSTLLRSLAAALSDRDLTLRTVRLTEAEQQMPFTALVDILGGLPERWLDALPPVQRRAVRGALLLEEAQEEIDPRAVAAGIAGVCRVSGFHRPIVVVIDEAQWLDPASRAMIVAAFRRIRGRTLTVVAATRPVEGSIDTWLPGEVHVVDLEPLGREQLRRLLDLHGADPGQAALRQLVERSRGNPLHALQLARHDTGQDTGLVHLVHQQVLALPLETRTAMLAAALAADPGVDTVAAVVGVTALELCAQVDPARAAGMVRCSSRIEFGHPLYAEAVIALSAHVELRRIRSRLATVEPDPTARVAHRAAVADEPDDALADELEVAALDLRRRAAWERSAEVLRLAAEHTVEPAARLRRQGLLGSWLVASGEADEGERLLRDVAAADGAAAHEATLGLAELCALTGRGEEARLLVARLLGMDVPPTVRARALLLDPFPLGHQAMLARAADAERLLEAAEATPEVERVRTAALTLRARGLVSAALPADRALAEAVAREGAAPPYALLQSAALLAATHAHRSDRYDEAERGYRALVQHARDTGDEESLPTLLAYAAVNHLRHGAWAAARADIAEARWSSTPPLVDHCLLEVAEAWAAGHAGDLSAASAGFTAPMALLEEMGSSLLMVVGGWQGEVLLGTEEHGAALAALDTALRWRDAADVLDPGQVALDTDWAEAALAAGDVDGAEARLATALARADRMGRENVLAACRRVRLLALLARGRVDEAVAAVPSLLAAYDAPDRRPLDVGRAHLVAGEVLRRSRARRGAAEQLDLAEKVFAASGHETWRGRAERALARVGSRAGPSTRLSGVEQHTAELVVAGLRNKEVAATLFVDVKTVEATLTRIYRKLGIRSRVELARALATAPTGPAGR